MRLIDNFNLEFSKNIITSTNIHNGFAEMKLDWFQLPLAVRGRLVIDTLKKELDYDDQWYYFSIFVPLLNGIPNFGDTYYYIDEYAPNEQMYEEFVKTNFDFPGFVKASVEIIDVVNLASALLPSKNMKKPA